MSMDFGNDDVSQVALFLAHLLWTHPQIRANPLPSTYAFHRDRHARWPMNQDAPIDAGQKRTYCSKHPVGCSCKSIFATRVPNASCPKVGSGERRWLKKTTPDCLGLAWPLETNDLKRVMQCLYLYKLKPARHGKTDLTTCFGTISSSVV